MSGPWRERPRGVLREAALLAAVLVASELACNLVLLHESLGQAKVLRALDGELHALLPGLLADVGWMLAAAALLMLGVTASWVALSRPARAALVRRWGGSRAARLGATALLTWAFACAWLSLHQAWLPGSRLRFSWASMLSGAFDGQRGFAASELLAPGLAALVVLGALGASLALDARLRRRAAAGAAAAVALLAGWEVATDSRELAPFRQDGNVVLLGVDSLQDNRLDPAAGSPAPRLAALLAASFRFDSAWTPLARTYPSWISILSGRWPTRHGIRFNLSPDAREAKDNEYLGERLAAAGWSTLHATDETRFSIVRARHGFERLVHPDMGVADFLVGGAFDFSAANLLRQTAAGHALFAPLRGNRASAAYAPRLFVRDVLAAVDEAPRDRPLFLALHLCGDHWPFTAPAPWAWAGADAVEGCLAMVDAQADELLEAFAAAGLLERSLLVLLSDHGDGWSGPGDPTNEHGDDFSSPWGNRVVLGLSGAGLAGGSLPAGRSAALVRSIDIAPTVLDALGLPPAPTHDGRSLLPLVRGEPDAPRELFAESELDRKQYTAKQLVERNARWYRVDQASGLVHLSDEGCEEFLGVRHYMRLRGDRRLVVIPYLRRFELTVFDAVGCEVLDGAQAVPPAERLELLAGLCEHFGLDTAALVRDAQQTGFLGEGLARG